MEGTKQKRSLTLPQNKSGIFRLVAAVLVFALLFWRVGAVATISQFGADTWLRLAVSGLILGGMYALIAIGYTLVYGILFMINFAHGEVMMIGAFGGYFIFEAFNAIPVTNARWNTLSLSKLLSDFSRVFSIYRRHEHSQP